jgi:hypothetical protein
MPKHRKLQILLDFILCCCVVVLFLPRRVLLLGLLTITCVGAAIFLSGQVSWFWWEQVRSAADITYHSTFATSYPAVLKGMVVAAFVLIRQLKRKGMKEVLENFGQGGADALLAAATIVSLTIAYHIAWTLPRSISGTAKSQPIPTPCNPITINCAKSGIYSLPDFALDPSRPELVISLTPTMGFTFTNNLPPGNYNFVNRKEYELTIANKGIITAGAVDLRIQPPLLPVVGNIVSTKGARGALLAPIGNRWNSTGNVTVGGCSVYDSYSLKVAEMAPGAVVKILFVLEDNADLDNTLSDLQGQVKDRVASFISGDFGYRYHGVFQHGRYSAPLEVRGGVMELSAPVENMSTIKRVGIMFVAPPCIPPQALEE